MALVKCPKCEHEWKTPVPIRNREFYLATGKIITATCPVCGGRGAEEVRNA